MSRSSSTEVSENVGNQSVTGAAEGANMGWKALQSAVCARNTEYSFRV